MDWFAEGGRWLAGLGQVLILLGALLFSTAGVGLIRLRDAFARSSAIATAAGLGVSLILVGVFLGNPSWSSAWKLAVAVALQLVTSAAGSISIARAAYLTGSPLHLVDSEADELAAAHEDGDEFDR